MYVGGIVLFGNTRSFSLYKLMIGNVGWFHGYKTVLAVVVTDAIRTYDKYTYGVDHTDFSRGLGVSICIVSIAKA